MSARLRRVLLWTGIAVSVVFTYLAVRKVDFSIFVRGLRESHEIWLVPSLAVLAVAVFVRALRWRFLFEPATRPPVRAVTSALLIGYPFNNILPARAGDAVRAVVLHQRTGTARVEGLATAATERLFDVLRLLVLLFAALPFLPEVTRVRNAAILAAVVGTLVTVLVVAVARYGPRPVAWLLRPAARLPGLSRANTEQAALSAVRGLAGIRNPPLAVTAFVLRGGHAGRARRVRDRGLARALVRRRPPRRQLPPVRRDRLARPAPALGTATHRAVGRTRGRAARTRLGP